MGDGGPTQFNVAAGGGDPLDRLLAQVQEAAAGVYEILGEMGRSKSGNVVYLARELDTANLVVLKLQRNVSGAAGEEYTLEVVRTLDGSLPGVESKCPECQAVLSDWERFCYRCGADLSGGAQAPNAEESAGLIDAVREATAGSYEILGQMDRAEGGGTVFFAKDLTRNGKLVALRLRREEGADPAQASYSIGETQVMRPLAAEFGKTQVLGAASVPEPPPLPPPVSSSPTAPPPARPAAPAGSRRRPGVALPRNAWLGIGGGVLLLAIVFFAFRGDDGDVPTTPPPPIADTTTYAGGTAVDSSLVEPDSADVVDPPPSPPSPPDGDRGTVELGLTLPAGADFRIDGRPVSARSLPVEVGRHRLSLSVRGYEPMSAAVTVQAGRTFTWRPTLKQVVEPPSPRPEPAPAPPPPPPPPSCARAYGRSDWQQASELCLAEATKGDVEAMVRIGRMRELGNGVQRDMQQAANWYLKAAAAGNRESQTRIGYLYRSGTGIKKDEKESARWFDAAAQQGDPVAMVEYGEALENGDGVKKDEAGAVALYRKAAAAGSGGAALRHLGRAYERGRGVQKNEAEAARYYLQAAERNDAESMYLLGRMYKDGRGVEKSATQALDWFKRSAALGNREAADEARKLEKS